MSTTDNIKFIAEALRNDEEVYTKIVSVLDATVATGLDEFKDVIAKYTDPENASVDVIDNIILENGFGYIKDLTDTLTGIERDILLNFISLLHLLKGHRSGLELVLTVLGFESSITEWFEQNPKGEPNTFIMDINFNLSIVTDVFDTLEKLRTFVREYVYPILSLTNINVDLEFANPDLLFSGFVTIEITGEITNELIL